MIDDNRTKKMKGRPRNRVFICIMLFMIICLTDVAESVAAKRTTQWLGNIVVNTKHGLLIGSSAHETSKLLFWSLSDGKLVHHTRLRNEGKIQSMVLSPDDNHLAVLMSEHYIGCYSIQEQKWLWKTKAIEHTVGASIRFSQKGDVLLFVGMKSLVTYAAQTGVVIKHDQNPFDIRKGYSSFSPTGKYFALWGPRWSHSDDTTGPLSYLKARWVKVFDTENTKEVFDMSNLLRPFKDCGGTFTPDERFLLLGTVNGTVRTLSFSDNKVVKEWRAYGHDSSVFSRVASSTSVDSLMFSGNGKLLATFGTDVNDNWGKFIIKIWDYSSDALLKQFHMGAVIVTLCAAFPMAFDFDGRLFALEQNESLCIYDTGTWNPLWCKDRNHLGTFY